MSKILLVIILILVTHQVCLICCKTLPANSNENDVERKNTTTSYYNHNIFGPNTYAFGFEVNDKKSGNIQFRDERRYGNGTVQGSYGYLRPDGSMTITNFLADDELGYVIKSQNFEPGDETKWQESWPSRIPKKPTVLKETDMVNEDKGNLNLTSILLPVEPIIKEQGIDLNPPQLENELVNPAVLEVINGEAPLISDTEKKNNSNNSISFKTINKFIPPEFPIVPFQLPSEDIKINLNGELSEKPIPVLKKTNDSHTADLPKPLSQSENDSFSNEEYVKSQQNKSQMSLPTAAIKMKTLNESNFSNSSDKVINQTRQ